MSYEHKDELSSRNPKTLLTNILPAEDAEYELDVAPTVPEHSDNQDKPKEEDVNVLPEEADALLTEIANTVVSDEDTVEPKGSKIEQYADEDEVDFDPEEPKRAFEKKKKGRDYVEFRDQYYRY